MASRDRRSPLLRSQPWRAVAGRQAGVVSRSQLIALGCTDGQLGALLDSRRWRPLGRGVYATFTGPVPPFGRAWAAVLAAGPGAALGGRSALWVWGVVEMPHELTVCVPWERQSLHEIRGSSVVRRRGLIARVHPAAQPPRLRLEEAVLDVTEECARAADVVDVVLRATSGRRTTPGRLRAAMAGRARLRHRRLLGEILGEAADGVQSALERRYRRAVERAHGLPRGTRNRPEPVLDDDGRHLRNRYRDVRYRRWRTVVELDGLAAHPQWQQHLDRRRDNSVTVAGDRALRFGWTEVVDSPCLAAVDLVTVLRLAGWRQDPVPCSPGCPVTRQVPRLALPPLQTGSG